eukprot:TRINITY_DN2024_c0_g1_i2.p1 TRINITY_DN2024_c0_g1~~TRINITY_DN2024_c0_g1_i2.p1  ORF type:complete len:361 (+),score=123.98 TRINITY_DN2024_c0_g1_i2:440-1522(+)
MVDFCGWDMPVKYNNTITEAVKHCRENASLFDVSHMGQLRFDGPDREKFIEAVTVADVKSTNYGRTKLSVLLTENGTIIDDLMVTRHPDHIWMVVNAATKDGDLRHFRSKIEELGMDVSVEDLSEERSLLALQGPKAAEVLQRHVEVDLNRIPFMSQMAMLLDGIPVKVSRCGYTGEDGFEISIPTSFSNDIALKLVCEPEVKPTGLGARDALRLEAGLCLYGNDMDTTTTPVEASLMWLISKKRRAEGGFPGHQRIMEQLNRGPKRRRVGFLVEKGAPARDHSLVYDSTGEKIIGEVTSGSFSPILGKPCGMVSIDNEHSKIGTDILIEVRGKKQKAKIAKMPFVPNGFYRIPDELLLK